VAVRTIVLMGDPVLREQAEPVEAFGPDLESLVQDMFETMYHADGVGLAAPQIGISRRILVVDVRSEESPEAGRYALVNPEVVESSSVSEKATEGCLSIPGLEDVVSRPASVQVRGFDPAGREVTIAAEGLLARALQHEIDHLDGVLFLDRISALKRRMLLKKWKKLQEDEG
jgi:peptide deformylase